MYQIESLPEWQALALKLHKNGYRVWQTQFGIDLPEGFRVRFSKTGKRDIDVMTHDPDVYNAIMKFRET